MLSCRRNDAHSKMRDSIFPADSEPRMGPPEPPGPSDRLVRQQEARKYMGLEGRFGSGPNRQRQPRPPGKRSEAFLKRLITGVWLCGLDARSGFEGWAYEKGGPESFDLLTRIIRLASGRADYCYSELSPCVWPLTHGNTRRNL
jgi:hypothetical protein